MRSPERRPEKNEKLCPMCNRIHYPPDLMNYAFKKVIKIDRNRNRTVYFCGWGCLQKFRKEHGNMIVEEEE